jgi:hypothetical protein
MSLSSTRNALVGLSVPLAFLLLLTLAKHAACQAPTPLGRTAEGLPFYQWDPSQSWPGGAQADPRLDRSVIAWGAGIPLGDVFASVKEQTGVEIGFFPPGDDNERICVNLYLNSENPPSLRDLMAQLSWVTDCAFAYAKSGEDEPSYHLLSTSIGAGAMSRMRGERDALIAALEAGAHPDMQVAAQIRSDMLTRLPELATALGLTRDEAIRRYKGKDDLMLLAALDPTRRLIGELVLSLSDEQLDEAGMHVSATPRLSEMTAEQRSRIREALEARAPFARKRAEVLKEHGRPVGQWDDWAWVQHTDPEVLVGTGNPTGSNLIVRDPEIEHEGRPYLRGFSVGFLQLVVDPRWATSMSPRSQVDLRRLLGEEVSEEEEIAAFEEWNRGREQHEKATQVEAHLAGLTSLSADAEARLSSVNPSIGPGEAHALWQAQEVIAATSGFHIVSDCFSQRARSLKDDLDALQPDGAPDLTALLALKLHCAPRQQYPPFPSTGAKGWEWGDAGAFLRFRSEERDLWRAAFLPAHVQAEVDSWVEPYLPESADSQAAAAGIRVPVDPKNCIWLLQQTTGAQRGWGGRLIYGDPTDRRNGYRSAFRGKLLEMLREIPHLYRLLGNLSDDQWERLQAEGLTYGPDFSPPVTDEDRNRGFWLDRRKGDVLRVVEVEQEMLDAARERFGPVDFRGIFVYRDGEIIDGDGLLLTAYVQPAVPRHLTR